MKKSDLIKNPLFEKLLERTSKYEPLYNRIYEQENTEPAEKKEPGDLEKIVNEIIFGAYSLMNSAIISFPVVKYKDDFSPKFISTIRDLKSDSSPSVLMDKISKTFTSFVEGASSDPAMEGFKDAYDDYRDSMNFYVQAMEELKKQEPEKIESDELKKSLSTSVEKSVEGTEKSLSNKTGVNESLILNESLEEKRSKRFSEKGNVVAFVNNCKTLVSSIKAKIDQISTYRVSSPGLKTPGEYSSIFTDLLNRANKLEGDAKTTRKSEGKKTKDDNLIKEYNEIYLGIKQDFDRNSSSFDEKVKNERIEYLKSLKYSRVSEILSKAVLSKKAGDSKVREATKTMIASKKEGEEKGTENKPGASKLQIKNPIKRSEVKSKKNADVEEFQKLVIEKFKSVKGVSETDIFKKFIKYGADGLFGPTTAGIVQGLKAGFGLNDKSTDITQELIDKISTENLSESRVTKFSDFVKLSKIMEKFDSDAFKKVIDQGGFKDDEPVKKIDVASAIKNSGTDKKISQDEIKREIEKGIEKFKSDLSREEMIKKLTKIDGVTKNENFDGVKSYAIAKSPGISFFDNGRALRIFDKKMGYYNIEKDEFKGDDGSVDKLSRICKAKTPNKYSSKVAALTNDLRSWKGAGSRDDKLYMDLMKWSKDSIKLLASAYKQSIASSGKSGNLYDDLNNEWKKTDAAKKFMDKFGESLKG